MPLKTGPEALGAALQAFHGFDIEVKVIGHRHKAKIWRFRVRKTGFILEGKHAEVMAALRGYQAGYHAGRMWTKQETDGLRRLIEEVENRFRKSA